MFSDHWVLIVILLLIALVVFGPKRLPELGQSLGRALNEFRSATHFPAADASSATTIGQAPAQPPVPANSGQAAAPAPEVVVEPAPGPSESQG